jgi:hypothetical protein
VSPARSWRLQPLTHGQQQRVAHVVPVLVVHRLEAVQVEQVQRHQAPGAGRRQRQLQPLLQAAPVGQTGECVGVGQPAQRVALGARTLGLALQPLHPKRQHTHPGRHLGHGGQWVDPAHQQRRLDPATQHGRDGE